MTTQTKAPMEFPQIGAQVARLLAQHLDKPLGDISPDSPFTELGMDSLSVVEFVLRLEDHFGIEVPDEAIEGIRTVEDAARKVEELLLAQVRAADHSAVPPLPPGWKVNREWTDREAAYPSLPADCRVFSDASIKAATLGHGQLAPDGSLVAVGEGRVIPAAEYNKRLVNTTVEVPRDDPYHDLLTHSGNWRNLMIEERGKHPVAATGDVDDRGYWDHEIAALDRLVAFHRELVGKPLDQQHRELCADFAEIGAPMNYIKQVAAELLTRYRLVPRKAI
jgi:acyl carrier protein